MNRLYPLRNSGRYYILTELRKKLVYVIGKYLVPDTHCVLLDFGCGSMPYKPLFNNYVKQYLGADIKENINAEIEISNGELQLESNSVNIVLSSQVLEHVENIKQYLSEAARILKESGYLILSTHGIWQYHPDSTDFWRWTKDGLSQIISETNEFEIKEIVSVMGMTATGLQLFQDGVVHKVPRVLRKFFLRFISSVQNIADNKNKYSNDASVFILVAQKKGTNVG